MNRLRCIDRSIPAWLTFSDESSSRTFTLLITSVM